MHATSVSHRAVEHPIRQRGVAQGLTGLNVFLHHVRHAEPACFLPQLERTLLHAKAPAHAKVHITGVVGNGAKVHGGVMEGVAQNRPQKLTLRTLCIAQQLHAFSRRLFQHTGVDLIPLFGTGHIGLARQIKAQDVAALFLEEACLGFLAQVTHVEQGLEHLGGGKAGIEGIELAHTGRRITA